MITRVNSIPLSAILTVVLSGTSYAQQQGSVENEKTCNEGSSEGLKCDDNAPEVQPTFEDTIMALFEPLLENVSWTEQTE